MVVQPTQRELLRQEQQEQLGEIALGLCNAWVSFSTKVASCHPLRNDVGETSPISLSTNHCCRSRFHRQNENAQDSNSSLWALVTLTLRGALYARLRISRSA